jgi:hypothetical protein
MDVGGLNDHVSFQDSIRIRPVTTSREGEKSMAEQPTLPGLPIVCPIWKSTIVRVIKDGLEIKCKSCRGLRHIVSRVELQQKWKELDEQAAKQQDVA